MALIDKGTSVVTLSMSAWGPQRELPLLKLISSLLWPQVLGTSLPYCSWHIILFNCSLGLRGVT